MRRRLEPFGLNEELNLSHFLSFITLDGCKVFVLFLTLRQRIWCDYSAWGLWQLPPCDPLSNRFELLFNQLSNNNSPPVDYIGLRPLWLWWKHSCVETLVCFVSQLQSLFSFGRFLLIQLLEDEQRTPIPLLLFLNETELPVTLRENVLQWCFMGY